MTGASELYVGLMSGTSADAVDAALVDFSGPRPRLLYQINYPLPDPTRREILQLMTPGANEIDRLGALDRELGELFAEATRRLLWNAGVEPRQVRAIGCHGQTVRHRPPGTCRNPFTLQIGDANVVAERTGVTTAADFRRRDMAVGGQGAPLVPAFHGAVFHSDNRNRAILNIGGIANLTWLPAEGKVLGYDTGPGNALMDGWSQRHRDLPFDRDGQWADRGTVQEALLNPLLQHPYFAKPAPKSTGREEFTLDWLDQQLTAVPQLPPEDVQATLLELTARSITGELAHHAVDEIYVCGGGAHNRGLTKRLKSVLPGLHLGNTDELGVPPDWVEAAAFAWLAKARLEGRSGNLPAVTGAERAVVLGSLYPAEIGP